jgi:ATP-dependent Lhr-like helicase
VERRLLARIHRSTLDRLRREIEPVTAQDFMRFLLRWQHVAPHTQLEGRRGLLAVIEQLQGFELAAGAWEESVLPARVAGYRGEWLETCAWPDRDVGAARRAHHRRWRARGGPERPSSSRATP